MISKLVIALFFAAFVSICQGSPLDLSLNIKCPKTNGNVAIRFVDPQDCRKYYTCDWGVAIKQECPHDLHFNSQLSVCDAPESAGCQVSYSQQLLSNYVVDPDHIQPDVRCPKNNPSTPYFFKHSTNCARYYVCNWGLAIPMFCPPDLVYNEQLRSCDFKENVQC